jgi:hypothetical protein
MKRIFIAILFSALTFSSHAQNKYVDSLKTVLASTSDPFKRFNIFRKIGQDVFRKGYGSIDSLTCFQMLEIAKKLNNDSLLAISYSWIGDFFLINKGDNTTSLEYFFKGIPLAAKTKDKPTLCSLYLDIAAAYFNLNNPGEAIIYIRRGGDNLPDPSSFEYDFMAAQYQLDMATYFILQQQPDSALHFVQALNETNLRLKTNLFKSYAQYLSGEVYDQLGEKTLAEVYYKKANALADSSKFYDEILNVKTSYTKFLLKNNATDEARVQARKLLETGRQARNNQMKLAGAGFLREVFDKLQLADSAYYYSRLESALKDSIFSQNNINKLQTLTFNEELRIREEKVQTAAEAEKRKQNLAYALIALGIVTFLILLLLLSRSIITNTKVIEFFGVLALLLVFEFLNLLLHPFLELATNHSALLMLIALVCVAAFLIPGHHALEKWSTKKLVEKNKAIRLANAKKTIEKLEGKTTDT